ncbi:MAG TPA: condensation domain-containing protein, partial [Blastocatellia bacterium]|nr:condensation domain-containing protein [Blastocatellia bacterium]
MSSTYIGFLSPAAFDQQLLADKEYWLRKLSGDLVIPGIRPDLTRPQDAPDRRELVDLQIDEVLSNRLQEVCNGNDELAFVVLVTALEICLHKYTGHDDIIVGTAIHRAHSETSDLNRVLVLRDQIGGMMTIRQLLADVRRTLSDAYSHQKYSFDRLTEILNIERPRSRNALFSTAIVLENINNPDHLRQLGHDLTLAFAIRDRQLHGVIRYSPELFLRETILPIAGHYREILDAVLRLPDSRVEEIEISADSGKGELIYLSLNANRRESTTTAAIKSGSDAVAAIPPNRIPPGCQAITPEMLPLVKLTQSEIDVIMTGVPGGGANIQDIYPLTPLQEGILFHHLMTSRGDAYLVSSLLSFDTRRRLDDFIEALQVVIARYDILRTAVVWERISEPAQVVWRKAPLSVEEIAFDPSEDDVAAQLRKHYSSRRIRIDLRRAPLMHGLVTHDAVNERWLLLWVGHHLIIDHATIEIMVGEAQIILLGEMERLPEPIPFRNFVAQARFDLTSSEHEAFFRQLLGDVDEPTAPFGLLDAHGVGSGVEEARIKLEANLVRRLRERARLLRVSAASLCHLAWAQVLARISGRDDVVFGTVLSGRMRGVEGIGQTPGLFINTLPVRIRIGEQEVEQCARRIHTLLAELMQHEHASLALAQRCSGVNAPTPLFGSLLNYRHHSRQSGARSEPELAWAGIDVLDSVGRSNYPLSLSIDDLGEVVELGAQGISPIDSGRVCHFMQTALERLVEVLETSPETSAAAIDVMPEAERRLVLSEWNATGAEYPQDRCVHELFEEQVERTPGHPALKFEGETLSYAELNARANRLAHHLRRLGVGPETLVGLFVERSPEMVVGLLGILKAGG